MKHLTCIILCCIAFFLAAIPSFANEPIVIEFVGVSPPVSGCACQAVEVTVRARDYDETTSGVGYDDLVFQALPYGLGWTPTAAPECDEDGWWRQTFTKTFDAPGEYPSSAVNDDYFFRALDLDIFHGEDDLLHPIVSTKVVIQDHYETGDDITCAIDAPEDGQGYAPNAIVSCSVTASDVDKKNCQDIGDAVTYLWSATEGQFSGSTTNSTATWVAPSAAGTYTITVTVDDDPDDPEPRAYCGLRSDPEVPVSVTVTVGIIHVKPESMGGDDDNDGLTWDTAKQHLNDVDEKQGALSAAYTGGEIWVAGDSDDPYEENITLKSGVGLYGGFDTTESRREDRDWRTNTTTLNGGGVHTVVTSPEDAGSDTIVDGFTITNGLGQYAGGVDCTNSSPTIANNTITENQAWAEGGFGGGIYCSNSTAMILNNTIISNSAPEGGGVYCTLCPGISLVNNLMYDNSATMGDGGAIYLDASWGVIAGNTVVKNTAGSGAFAISAYCGVFGTTTIIANNIIALNYCAGVFGNNQYVILRNNDVCDNPESGPFDYCGSVVPDSDISQDPVFADRVSGDYHLSPSSPCINAGDDTEVETGWLDMDGQARVNGLHVDIGADEYYHPADCTWYTVTLTTAPAPMGSASTVTATVLDPVTGNTIMGWRVDFALTAGEISSIYNHDSAVGTVDIPPVTGNGYTGNNGKVYADITRSTRGAVTVTAQTDNSCETGQVTVTTDVPFYDPNVPIEIFFCLDATGSMGGRGGHRAVESVEKFLNDMVSEAVYLRVLGGVKFNEPSGGGSCNDSIDIDQFISLDSFTSVADFINVWVKNGYAPDGGDNPELQLDALQLGVQDMNAYSTPSNPNRYIVLITDDVFHENTCGSTVTEGDVIDELTASGCRVYISLWEDPSDPWLDSYYDDLLVNGGEFDPCNYYTPETGAKYPLARLRARILP